MNNHINKHRNYKMRKKKRRRLRLKIFRRSVGLFFAFIVFVGGNKLFTGLVQATPNEELSQDRLFEKKENMLNDGKELEEDGSVLDKSDWKLVLVNPWNKLPDDFLIELTSLKNGHSIDKRIYPDLQKMMDDAGAEGLSPIICSSFRTKEKQQTLFDNQVNQYIAQGYSKESAILEASKWVAIPGTSEHQVGLAVDIVASDYQILDENQENTPEQKWLMENSYKYGFILRYPTNKSHITGIGYEPWHYRYVGKEAAKEIYEKNICLEEYLNN